MIFSFNYTVDYEQQSIGREGNNKILIKIKKLEYKVIIRSLIVDMNILWSQILFILDHMSNGNNVKRKKLVHKI